MSESRESKERRWNRIYEEAEFVECACGCGELIKNKDHYGRNKLFISGHNNRKYKEKNQYKREWDHRNRKSRYEYKKEYIRKRKIELIKIKGGECKFCGYKFTGDNECCFDFHHIDPKTKKFALNQAQLNKKSIELILEELEKCDLLCALCHRVVHNNYN